TGLEPARLSPLAPETSASTIPPPGLFLFACAKVRDFFEFSYFFWIFFLILWGCGILSLVFPAETMDAGWIQVGELKLLNRTMLIGDTGRMGAWGGYSIFD
ncbi:MAG: hypothetical protein K2H76_07170, partial [Muribaculaceae bacterium]|nr:hypothetical protein [Muribaculaceae bacterium]